MSGDRPPTGAEAIVTFWSQDPEKKSNRKKWSGPGNLTHLAHKALRGKNKFSSEKPLDQALDLVSWFSDPGGLVIDFTCGVGTTMLACKLLGRDGIGCEIDEATASLALRRVTEPLSDRDLERVARYIKNCAKDVVSVPQPKNKSQEKAYERAQRRASDAQRVIEFLGLPVTF